MATYDFTATFSASLLIIAWHFLEMISGASSLVTLGAGGESRVQNTLLR